MKFITPLLVLMLCAITSQLAAQVPLSQIEGRLEVYHPEDTTTTLIGKNSGTLMDVSFRRKNTFVGTSAGRDNTTGSDNSFFGRFAGRDNTTGGENSFFGTSAGEDNTTGNDNSFFGRSAGEDNTTGSENSFFGTYAGEDNTTGGDNSFFGASAGCENSIGKSNSFFGTYAGVNNTTGSDNSFFGTSAGGNKRKANRSTMIGYEAEASIAGDSIDRAIAIGYKARVGCHNCAVIGGTGEDAVRLGIGTTTPNHTLDIVGNANIRGVQKVRSNTAQQLEIINEGPGGSVWRVSSSADNWGSGGGKFLINNGSSTNSSSLAITETITENGNVGIGTTNPGALLDVNGMARIRSLPNETTNVIPVYARSLGGSSGTLVTNTSDARLKENIVPLSNALDMILSMDAYY